jgi:serine/threonine protein kinase
MFPVAAIGKLERYRELSRLGAGAMASVTLAEDTTLGRLVALKHVHALGAAHAEVRVRREALIGASLSHLNLVGVYDVVSGEDGELVIVHGVRAGPDPARRAGRWVGTGGSRRAARNRRGGRGA